MNALLAPEHSIKRFALPNLPAAIQQPIDFVRFAEACGGVGFACARPEEVRPALEAAWRITDRPALVEATIDNDADVSAPDAYLSFLKGA